MVAVAFVAVWIAVMALLSRIGGWSTLAERYPARSHAIVETVRRASLALEAGRLPVHYSYCLSVSVGPEGFGVSTWLPFRAFHPTLFVPWTAVERCQVEKIWLWNRTVVYLSAPVARMTFGDRAGQAVKAQWRKLA